MVSFPVDHRTTTFIKMLNVYATRAVVEEQCPEVS